MDLQGKLAADLQGKLAADLQAKGWRTWTELAELKFHLSRTPGNCRYLGAFSGIHEEDGVKGVPQDHESLLAAVEGFIVLGAPDKHPRSCISNMFAGAHVFSSFFFDKLKFHKKEKETAS